MSPIEPEFAKKFLPRLLTNEEKIVFNKEHRRRDERRELIFKILETDEMRWVNRFFPHQWNVLFENLMQLSYFPEGQQKLKAYFLNINEMLKDILPNSNFDFDPHR